MKKFLSFILFLGICFLVTYYNKEITSFIIKEVVYKKEIQEYTNNEYDTKQDYDYVKITNNFYPNNKEDIKNILYTILNSGMDSFSFFCSNEYDNCLEDVEAISTDYHILSNLNNLVHPYNSYNKLYLTTNNLGKATISIEKLYSQEEIESINIEIENIKKSILKDDMSDRDKIKAFHDYVINNTTYDEEKAKDIKNNSEANNNDSHKASGVLKNHIALCSGYTDLMAIFLNSINIPNYKISNDEHIWNAVYVDGKWYHLDLTWDDPVTSTGEDILIYDFFLITTKQLEELETTQHYYDKTVYGF